MSSTVLLSFVLGYFLILLIVAYFTSRKSNNESFFIGNRNSNWMLVAFGMIGTSLSGVTFVSVPGGVLGNGFAYFQLAVGYLIGYIVIAFVLLPLYYRLNLTSIYNYFSTRMGFKSYKTGASFFILSRTLGATARLYLVVNILQTVILSSMGVPFWVTTLIILLMILLYTFKGGVKTIVWTDTLQTLCMLLGLIVCVVFILNYLNLDFSSAMKMMSEKGYSKTWYTEPNSRFYFLKQILAGAFITITMTGMDQEMMQKNISVKTLKGSQKNMISLAIVMLGVILLFLILGGLLYLFAESHGASVHDIVENGKTISAFAIGDKNVGKDNLFPAMALDYMPPAFTVVFVIALISALFPSADGAITALTSSFCIDILGIQRSEKSEAEKKKIRQIVHLSFSLVFLIAVLVFKWINEASMIDMILKIATYTYGPLLGLFAFGILTKRKVIDYAVPFICIFAPIASYLIDINQELIFGQYQIGTELIVLNGLITFILLFGFSKSQHAHE
ncbi:MAG TPA: sodium:solute symporter [Chitinophagaceae bacterium]|nr:MAG: sodium:solute symporter [Bacteroidetes bacterium OLB11]HMN32694.1 sodium:solute symporter [Chitinophagaceae bacterium]